MRTNSNIESSFAKTDAMVFFPIDEIIPSFAAAADGVVTRNAAGDWSINQIASKTNIYGIPLAGLIYRLGLAPDLQEQFGTAAGVAGPTAVANTGSPAPADGRPPFAGATQLTPPTGKTAKGVKILDITLHYLIGTNPLAAHTCRLDKVVMPATGVAAAPTVTPIIATGANGLATAASANLYATNVAVAAPAFTVDDLATLIFEVSAQTPAGGTYRMYGVTVHAAFNYL